MVAAKIKIQLTTNSLLTWLIWLFSKREYKIRLPESWAEVPARKLRKVLAALMLHSQNPTTSKVAALKELLQVPPFLFYRIDPLQIVEKLEPCVGFLAVPIAIPLVPSVRGGWYRWLLPAPAAKDITLGQYLAIERAWYDMVKGGDNTGLLLANILRPDTRTTRMCLEDTGLLQHATPALIGKWARRMKKLPNEWIYYVLQYWAAQRQQLQTDFPDFFSGDSKGGGEVAWESIPARIAESNVFGPVKDVLHAPARTYLAWANAKRKEEGEQEQKSLQDLIRANHNKFLA